MVAPTMHRRWSLNLNYKHTACSKYSLDTGFEVSTCSRTTVETVYIEVINVSKVFLVHLGTKNTVSK